MAKTSKTRKPHGKFDAALLALDLALLAGVVLLLWGVDRGFRRQAEIAALKDNRFLTTEWRLMRELKERTDQELRDKDREIDVLRQQYLRLKGSGSSADLLADIEAAMARAESERAAILSARANPEVAPVAAPPSVPSASSLSPGPSQGSGGPADPAGAPAGGSAAAGAFAEALPGRAPDYALAELLRRRIVGLEEALRRSQAGSAAIERELAALRLDAARQAAGGPSASAASATQAAAPGPAIPSARAAPWSDADAVAAILSALEGKRAGLDDPETVLSLSDLKTRSIMRAIVRSPAIRSQYPDLSAALDRYLELVEKVGYLKGKQEGLDEARQMVEGATSGAAR
jgi:hypothetical protein